MSVLNENQLLGASGAGGDYEIEQSLRFNSGDGSYLSKTLNTPTNRNIYTYSSWVKRGVVGSAQYMFFGYGANNDQNFTALFFESNDTLKVGGYSDDMIVSTQLFRDPSAWYHIVMAVDTTQSTQSNRIKMYVNGLPMPYTVAGSFPTQNENTGINGAHAHSISGRQPFNSAYPFDGYIGEVNFIDGQALTPSSFGETGKYGEWKPIEVDGITYGTNGFYLPFKQDYTVEGFSTVVYEANTQVRYIGGVGFKPDFLWFKNRTRSSPHRLVDTLRGLPKTLSTNTTGAEATGLSDGTVNRLVTSVTADGFTLGIDDGGYRINSASGDDIVAWTWDMGGSTASNTSGTINSSVRANQAYGQSIVTYTGSGSDATVGHGLASAPTMVITKRRTSGTEWWIVWHSGFCDSDGDWIALNNNQAARINGEVMYDYSGFSSSTFGVRSGGTGVNVSNATQVSYCFHDVANYSKFSSYSGNGSTTGPTVTLGFSPAFVMIKRTDAAEHWKMYDNVRNPFNPVNTIVNANEADAESTSGNNTLNFTATGFQCTSTSGATNASGGTYIYAAFADTREYAYWLDQSGNNNDWTSEGGLTESDVMVDSPTNNFAVLNVLDKEPSLPVSEGNTKIAASGSAHRYIRSTFELPQTGKHYWEVMNTADSSSRIGVGIATASIALNDFPFSTAGTYGFYVGDSSNNAYYKANGSADVFSIANTSLDVFQIAYDADSNEIWFGHNNTFYDADGSTDGSPATGVKPTSTSVDSSLGLYPFCGAFSSGTFVVNFGQDSSFAGNKTPQGNQDANGIGDFYYAPPTGFLALCTANLPDVDVIPSDNFNPVIYSGTGADNRVLSGVGFTPDLGIFKRRNGTGPSQFFDTVRGATKQLRSDNNVAESTQGNKQKTFTSDGYTLGTDAQINGSGGTYVAWNWKAGGSASSNSNGSITSQVSVNAAAGFSIVTYTGTGSNATVGHGLSKAPNMSWIKPRNFNDNWIVTYDAVDGSDDQAYLNTTNAGNSPAAQYTVSQNATTLGLTSWNNVNDANDTYVAYCFHNVDGYLKVGKYIGNNNANGTFVHLGFKAKFILIKEIVTGTGNGEWQIFDTARSTTNVVDDLIAASTSGAESVGNTYQMLDILSNGFKLRSAYGTSSQINYTTTYIYLAFAENPFKHSNAR